jgi:molecular chaperone GrpE
VTPSERSDPAPSTDAHPASEEADSLEVVAADIERVLAERDEYLDSLRRLQADFENFRKRIARQEAEHLARATEALVVNLLPVLDACDAALAHGADDVKPVAEALFAVLERDGLEKLDPLGKPFDPEEQEAVVHVPAEEGADGQVVAEVMRAGYRFKGRVLRPAMVSVRG